MQSKTRVGELTQEEVDLDEMVTRRVKAYLGLKNVNSVRQISLLERVPGRKGVYRTSSVTEYRKQRGRRRRRSSQPVGANT